MEKDVVPGASPANDLKIRKAIIHLRSHLLDRHQAIDHPEVNRTFKLFAYSGSRSSRNARASTSGIAIFVDELMSKRVDDPHYTLRGLAGGGDLPLCGNKNSCMNNGKSENRQCEETS